MPATFTWTVQSLAVKPTDGDLTNVVVTAQWNCAGQQDGYTGSYYQSSQFQAPDASQFIPFDNLKLNDVLGWIWECVDKSTIEGYVQTQIDNQINPPIIYPALPWA